MSRVSVQGSTQSPATTEPARPVPPHWDTEVDGWGVLCVPHPPDPDTTTMPTAGHTHPAPRTSAGVGRRVGMATLAGVLLAVGALWATSRIPPSPEDGTPGTPPTNHDPPPAEGLPTSPPPLSTIISEPATAPVSANTTPPTATQMTPPPTTQVILPPTTPPPAPGSGRQNPDTSVAAPTTQPPVAVAPHRRPSLVSDPDAPPVTRHPVPTVPPEPPASEGEVGEISWLGEG